MKRVFVIALIVFISMNCAPTIDIIYPVKRAYKVDFSKYSKENFLITPLKYNGNYKSIGLVSIIAYQGAELKQEVINYDQELGESLNNSVWIKKEINLDSFIDDLYKMAVEMGANAIIDFQVNKLEKNYAIFTNPVNIYGYEVKGFAIQRMGTFK